MSQYYSSKAHQNASLTAHFPRVICVRIRKVTSRASCTGVRWLVDTAGCEAADRSRRVEDVSAIHDDKLIRDTFRPILASDLGREVDGTW